MEDQAGRPMDGGGKEALQVTSDLPATTASAVQAPTSPRAWMRLEGSYPDLSIQVTGPLRPGWYILRPQDEEAVFLFTRFAREEPFSIALVEIKAKGRSVVL